jgi:hypothetical protein
MRKTATITINDRVVTVHELTNRQIWDLRQQYSDISTAGMVDIMLPLCVDCSKDFLMDLTPSETKVLLEKFKEVNEVFFDLLGSLGIMDALGGIKETVAANMKSLLSNSSSEATVKPFGITDGDGLQPVSE